MNGEDYQAVVYNSARDGNLRRLRIFLEERSADWLSQCFSTTSRKTPPLVVAARNGHLKVVRYLLEKGADVSATGTVSFDGEVIPHAPALWAAAAAGHLEIVKCLVDEGRADLNQTTDTHSSPLRGACYDGHLAVVKYLVEKGADIELSNQHGHTPLMIAAFRMHFDVVQFLLSQGADPLRSSERGNTALHDAAEAGSAPITRLLLDAGAQNVADDANVTPLKCAALSGNEEVIRLFQPIVDSQQMREALKLYGATLVDKKMDLGAATKIWLEAVAFGEHLPYRNAESAYGNLLEVDSIAEIRDIIGDPDSIRNQALIVRERILGRFHPETHYFIRYRGAVYCDLGQLQRCFTLWMHALLLQQESLCPLHTSTMSTITSFMDTFMATVNDGVISGNVDVSQELCYMLRDQIRELLSLAVLELQRFKESAKKVTMESGEEVDIQRSPEYLLQSCLQLILLLIRLSPEEDKSELLNSFSVKDWKYHPFAGSLLRLLQVCRWLSLHPLHIACRDINKPITSRFPSADVIGCLIKAGADVNELNEQGETALHTLMLGDKPRQSVARLLLENGAHMFARTKCDQTCLQLLQKKLPNTIAHLKVGRFLTLKGISANAVRRPNIPYDYGNLIPADLIPFLNMH